GPLSAAETPSSAVHFHRLGTTNCRPRTKFRRAHPVSVVSSRRSVVRSLRFIERSRRTVVRGRSSVERVPFPSSRADSPSSAVYGSSSAGDEPSSTAEKPSSAFHFHRLEPTNCRPRTKFRRARPSSVVTRRRSIVPSLRFIERSRRTVVHGRKPVVRVPFLSSRDDEPSSVDYGPSSAVVRKGLRPVERKAQITLRVDSDVLEWFREEGPGYQSRMNAVLRAYKQAHTR